MVRAKELLGNWRVLLLLVILVLSIWAINPRPWHDGVAIRSVMKASAAADANLASPLTKTSPVQRERVIAINNEPVADVTDYYRLVSEITARGVNQTFTVKTDRNLYSLRTKPELQVVVLNETELVTVTTLVYNETTNTTTNVTTQELRNKTLERVVGVADIGLNVYDAPTTNIRQGLDLSGGTRVILKPKEAVTQQDLDIVLSNIKERLNVFGLSDIIVRPAKDLSGDQFIIVEIAGANKDDVRELLSNQGKFEARIGNETVFRGGDKDVTYVCRSPECSGIDPRVGCTPSAEGASCRFRFSISLSPAAAQRQAAVTKTLDSQFETGGSYLSQPLDLYLDDQLVDSLRISSDLKGRAVTDIEISGGGVGANQQLAVQDSLNNMKKLQTVLITGSLPVQLEIVKTDSISPLLGQEFVKNSVVVGLLVILTVVLIVFLRYRDLRVSLPMIVTMLSEVVIILGFAAVTGWNLDLAAIAAIIVAIGTGVDDQILIADETLQKEKSEGRSRSWKERLGRAFFIIIAAYVATVAAMAPLYFAGAGMLRGFAIVTIVGVTAGVLFARPAYAALLQALIKKDDES